MSKWIISFFVLLCLLVTPLLSCTGSGVVRIKMAGADSFNTYLATYAIREKIISSPDVDLSITLGDTRTYETALMAGNYNMGTLSNSRLAAVPQNKVPLISISTFVVHAGAKERMGVNFVLTQADSSITDPSDLRGKTIAVGNISSSGTSTLVAFLKKNYGLDAKERNKITDAKNEVTLIQTDGDLAELVRLGTYEVAMIGQNDGPKASKNAALKVLMNLDDLFYAEYGMPYITSTLVVNKSFQKNNPKAVEVAYELLKESLAYGEAHIDEIAARYAAEFGKGTTADFYKMIYNEHSGIRLTELESDARAVIMAGFEFAKIAGEIETLPDPDVIFGSPYVN